MNENDSRTTSPADAGERPQDASQKIAAGGSPSLETGARPAQDEGRKKQSRREKRDVHGWLVLDKPVGMTSTHAVSVIKRLFTARRAGHAGTLDPLASGLLPIALGEATKT